MKQSEHSGGREKRSRRHFLKTVVAASGGVAVAGAAGGAIAAESGEAEPERSTEKRGYHETSHIRDYYARARF